MSRGKYKYTKKDLIFPNKLNLCVRNTKFRIYAPTPKPPVKYPPPLKFFQIFHGFVFFNQNFFGFVFYNHIKKTPTTAWRV